MELFPAIDVQGGQIVRLRQGEARRDSTSVYGHDPLAKAREYAKAGARWIHFVDLDRAFGTGDNREVARKVIGESGLKVQVGGGLRTKEAVAEMFGYGAARVVLGTAAAMDPKLTEEILAEYGPERIAIGVDARSGIIAIRGWTQEFDLSAHELVDRVLKQGAKTVVYTEITRDGMLEGPDLDGAKSFHRSGAHVIVSGGVASLDDLRAIRRAQLSGAVIGRALYEGRFTLAQALQCALHG
jgi:phosphoribosylformimino-5-aminoimidazole carboxamide ribotide isomerase